MTRILGRLAILCGLALAGLWPGGARAAEIACGTVYQVVRGDTLHRIAMRAYGTGNYRAIFEANRDLLPDSASIEIGDLLLIPCLDGTGPRSRADAAAMGLLGQPAAAQRVPMATAAAAVTESPAIGLLSGPDFAPFADPRLPEGGMIAELVKLALERTAPDRPAELSFVNDWSRHLELLGSGEFDIGFPWYKPDCAQAARLAGSMRARCTGFLFSAPIFGVEMGFYVRAGDPLAGASAPEALHGRRICRPAGYFTFDLDQAGLAEPAVTRLVAPDAATCFALLTRGEADAVSLNRQMATGEISRLGLDGRVEPVPGLAAIQTLHVVAPEAAPEGPALIALVDRGLADLRESGRWFEVVSRHLGAFGMTPR